MNKSTPVWDIDMEPRTYIEEFFKRLYVPYFLWKRILNAKDTFFFSGNFLNELLYDNDHFTFIRGYNRFESRHTFNLVKAKCHITIVELEFQDTQTGIVYDIDIQYSRIYGR